MSYIIVLITASSENEARRIADGLIDARAVACVNIVPNVTSLFIWQGKKDKAHEYLLIAKTKDNKFNEVKEVVKRLHSYDVPEIISVMISDGDKDYLNWIDNVIRMKKRIR